MQPQYLNLQKQKISDNLLDIDRLNKFAKILRALIFATVEAGQSGHPGGSSSKVEQVLGLIFSGVLKFDFLSPKNSGRDRVVWSAGHCTPLLHSTQAFFYEVLRRLGHPFDKTVMNAVLPEDLVRFRHIDGPQGHAESYYPFSDYSTGPSGHGLSAAGGLAISHRGSGLNTRVFVFMGDNETAEGMTYEARNLLSALGADNLIVSVDRNHFGIDGALEEIIGTDYKKHWLDLGWNVIEINGHEIAQCIEAYKLAVKGFDNNLPVMILSNTIKGKDYGIEENTPTSHGKLVSHEEYVKVIKKLGFNIIGKQGEVMTDIENIIDTLTPEDCEFIEDAVKHNAGLIKPERDLLKIINKTLNKRKIVDPRIIKRPAKLPKELVFKSGEMVSTRQAAGLWFDWLMKQTAFFYIGSGDLSGSLMFKKTEAEFGLINKNQPLGRGIRFGIAEQNMAMFSSALTQDILPGGFRPISVFGTYGVFTSMMSNCIRLAVINNHLCPQRAGFFIVLGSHDGPETGQDGPTHQGLYWMSNFMAYPGIKVYKPLDANETIEMLFYALDKGEPIVLSVARPAVPVLKRDKNIPSAREAVYGAYVYKNWGMRNGEWGMMRNKEDNSSPLEKGGEKALSDNVTIEQYHNARKVVLVVSGSLILQNVLTALPELEKNNLDIKIINVTSPELFAQLQKNNPTKAQEILPDAERSLVITLHNGWKGWLDSFLLPADFQDRRIGVETYLKSGNAEEVYQLAELTSDDILAKVMNNIKK